MIRDWAIRVGKEMDASKVVRFLILLPFWTVLYLMIAGIFFLVLHEGVRLSSALLFGVLMGIGQTIWPPWRSRYWKDLFSKTRITSG